MIQGERHIHLQLVGHSNTTPAKSWWFAAPLIFTGTSFTYLSTRSYQRGGAGERARGCTGPVFASQCSCRTPSSVLHRSTSVHT